MKFNQLADDILRESNPDDWRGGSGSGNAVHDAMEDAFDSYNYYEGRNLYDGDFESWLVKDEIGRKKLGEICDAFLATNK